MKLDRILLAVDFSDSSLTAAQWAMRSLAPEAEFVLFHATSDATPPDFLADVLPPREITRREITRDAETRLRQFAAALPTGRLRTELAAGRTAEQIARAAVRADADLVLVGSHGHRRSAYDPVTSTAEELVRCCAVPVVVARSAPDHMVQRILVSVDGSSLTRRVIEWAGLLGSRSAAALMLLHVVDLSLYGTARGARSPVALEELQQRSEHATRAWLRTLADDAGLDPDRVGYHVVFGDPKFEIRAAADEHNADLLIMGSRGAAEVGPAHLGGVARAVLGGRGASVLVVTDPGSAPDRD
jgi:nucleotide-binding universal stress UspA family protein